MDYLYRMVHIDNISHILKYGITHRNSTNACEDYVPIGDSSIIQKRLQQYHTTESGDSFVIGDFIPFYFYARMPMLYNIQHGYGVKMVNAEDIVYVIVKLSDIVNDPYLDYVFSDGHAISGTTRFYGKESIDRIETLLDLDAIRCDVWGNDYFVREKKQAEFLLKGDVPVERIYALCCYSDSVRDRLQAMGAKMKIIVSKKAYY